MTMEEKRDGGSLAPLFSAEAVLCILGGDAESEGGARC
jgi:hypothetical protein